MAMTVKILLPSRVAAEAKVNKINGEALNGAFCLLPRHIDFTAALAPGIFSYETTGGEEVFWAVDEGVLVKCADTVTVAVRRAVGDLPLGELKKTVVERFEKMDQHEKNVRSAVAKIEAGFVRRFLEIHGRG